MSNTADNTGDPSARSSRTPSPATEKIRERAEQKAKSIPPPNLGSMTHGEIQQLLYEMQVKKFEAELQNEQFRSWGEDYKSKAEFLATVTENMLDMVFSSDLEGNITFAGGSYKILGYDLASLMGKNMLDFVHPEDLPRILDLFGESVASGYPRRVEYRNRCKDGSYLWLETLGNFITDENGIPQKIVFSSRNITDRKQAEDSLHFSHSLLTGIIESSPHGIFSLDRQYRYTSFNQAHAKNMKKMYGADIQLGRKFTAYQSVEADRQKSKFNMNRALNGEQFTIETFSGREDLSRAYISVIHYPIQDKKGNIIGVSVFANDITDQKEAQFIIERVRYSVDNVNDSIFWIDDTGNIIDVNEAACKNLGYTREELLAMCVADIDPCFPHDSWPEHWEKVTKTGLMRIESIHQNKEGQRFPVEVSITNQQFGGKPYNYVVAQDITERKQAEDALIESEALFRGMFNDHSAVMLLIDPDTGQIIKANQAAAQYYGYPPEKMPQMKIQQLNILSPAEVTKEMRSALDRHFNIFEFRHLLADEQVRDVEVHSAPITIQNQKLLFSIVRDITESKCAESAIRREEEKFRNLVENTVDWVWQVDTSGRYIYVSPQAKEQLGYEVDEILGNTPFDFMSSDEVQRILPFFSRTMEKGERIIALEDTLLAKNGSQVLFETNATPLYDQEGKMIGYMGTCRDITERKQAETALRDSEQRFKTIIQNLPGAVFAHDLEGRLLFVNKNASIYTGYSEQELLAMTIPDIDSGGFTKDDMYQLWNGLNIGESKTIHSTHTRKDGSKYPVEIHLNAINLDNQPIILPIVIDITERKQAENQLAEQNSLIKAIYSNAPLIMMVVDKDRRLRQVNGFAKQFAELSEEEMLGMQGGEALHCLHALDDPQGCGFGDFCRDCAIRNKVLETLENGVSNLQVEVSFDFSSGERAQALTLLLSTTPITFQGKDMALVIMMDITGRKESEKRQEKLKAQLAQAQKMESVGRLAGGVAHDFNNMLSIINGYAEITLDMLDPQETARENIREIYNAGKRSADIVRQLLAFARQQTISPTQLDLNDTISGMLKMLRRLIGENIELIWHPGNNLLPVKIDPSQVDQIMANLAVNARDAISDVGKWTIETKNVVCDEEYCKAYAYFIPGQYVMLAVSDDGCGMETEIQVNLFEPFFTTKETGKGTGLGLSTIYGIVKQNNGFINVYSEPGIGTTFKIYLPRYETNEVYDMPTNRTTEDMPTGSETILLVEDEPAILKMGREMIKRLGYTVLTAENPNDALQVALEYDGKIYLLVTDVIMPDMNGRDLSVRLSKNQPDLKTLYMSGYTADVIAHHGVIDEGVQFIQKPFSLKDLAVKVREAIEQE